MADAVAPGLLLAQGVGRIGNWFNQELYGKPTDLPWGLKIDIDHRVQGYEQYSTFHPTFLYELIYACRYRCAPDRLALADPRARAVRALRVSTRSGGSSRNCCGSIPRTTSLGCA
jgi:hypothetical protein